MKITIKQDTNRNLQRELRRRKFLRRAVKKKKKCFSAALKRKSTDKPRQDIWWKRAAAKVCLFCFWLGLGVLMLAASWQIFWRTGEVSFSDTFLEEKVKKTAINQEAEVKRYAEEYLSTGQEAESQADRENEGWAQEIFGIEIRIQDGKIVFFQEKEGQAKIWEHK